MRTRVKNRLKIMELIQEIIKLLDEEDEIVFNGVSCQYCGSRNLNKESENETFYGRVGCLDCNQWLQPVKLKKDRT